MTKVHGHITQLGVSGMISQLRVRGSIAQKRVIGSIVESGYVFAFAPAEAPTLLTAATVSDTQIDLGWTINSTRHIGHAIERTSVVGGLTGWSQIGTVLGATDVYSDKTCVEGTLYYYRVRAYRYGIYSDYSNVASDTTFSATWSEWSNSNTITIDNDAGGDALANYQINIILNAANFDFDIAKSDGSDLRFADTDDETLLSYYIESFDDVAETASIYVKVPNIPANSTKEIYMHYGNALAESLSSGANTFDYFDDFTTQTGIKDYFNDVGSFLQMLAYNHESSIYYNGKTYVVYSGYLDDPYIITYTHATSTWSLPIKIGINPVKLDGHECPCILIDESGYIHAFWGAHNSAIKYARSNNPEDISAWTARTDIDTDATYPQVFQKADDTIYLFYRLSVGTGFGYRTSVDGGSNWSAYTKVIDQKCYCNAQLDDDDKIHVAGCDTNDTSAYGRRDQHYLYLDDDYDWKDIEGNVLGLPYTWAAGTCYYDAAIGKSTSEPTLRIINGNPYLFFAEVDNDIPGQHKYKFAKYSGGAWVIVDIITTTLVDNMHRMTMDAISATEFHCYLMVGYKLEKWVSIDSGETWALDHIVMDDGNNYCEPIIVKNGLATARILIQQNALSQSYYNRMRTYLYGSVGFVQRNFTETWANEITSSSGQSLSYTWKYKVGYMEMLGITKGFVSSYYPQAFDLTSDNIILETQVETNAASAFGISSNIQAVSYLTYVAMLRCVLNDSIIAVADLNAAYAAWYQAVPGLIAQIAVTPALNTKYTIKFSRLANGDLSFDWGSTPIAGNNSTYTLGKAGLWVYIHTTASYTVPCTTKFYYLRIRKNSTYVPVITVV